MITADEGAWRGNEWVLEDGRVYGFDREGLLVFSGRYDSLSIPVDEEIADVLVSSRTPSEMSIRELVERSDQAVRSGQRIDELVVEIHQKIALPLATLVFVVLGGTITLMFNPRSRAGGAVLALLLVGIFQGLLWWTETLGRRGAMNPALAAWTPNILFGAIGLFLFLRVDRLASRDVWNRIRRFIPFVVILLAVGLGTRAGDIPLELTCEELSVSEDRTSVHASGGVHATMEGMSLRADELQLEQQEPNAWRIEASGHVELKTGESAEVNGERIAAVIDTRRVFGLSQAEAEGFSGRSVFVNSDGEEHTLYFDGERATIDFTEDGEIERIDAETARITTCDCCGVALGGQPYSMQAKRLILYPDRLLVAYGLVARIAGLGILWLSRLRPAARGGRSTARSSRRSAGAACAGGSSSGTCRSSSARGCTAASSSTSTAATSRSASGEPSTTTLPAIGEACRPTDSRRWSETAN